jgi:hypothetical protein
MPACKPNLTRNEIARAFEGDLTATFPPIISPSQLAELLGLSVKTIYSWIAAAGSTVLSESAESTA